MIDGAVAERFWAKVDKTGDCWEWTGGRSSEGYGTIKVDGRTQGAHRVSWTIHHGPIAQGCGTVKAIYLFHRRANSPDGHKPHCAACVANYDADRQPRNYSKEARG